MLKCFLIVTVKALSLLQMCAWKYLFLETYINYQFIYLFYVHNCWSVLEQRH